MVQSLRRGIAALITLSLVAASPVRAADLTVFAAASLKTALDEVAAAYTVLGGSKPVLSYAASSALAKQIEHAAPADLFLSADLAWMDYVAERGMIRPETRVNLLSNTLVLIAPAASQARVALTPGVDLAGMLGSDRLALADPDTVPAGRYAKAALTSLGIWQQIEPKITRSENVRVALLLVARGETPFGIVYGSDAMAEPGVRAIATFPAESHPPIVYPAAITAQSTHPEAAAFLAFLRAPSATAIFVRSGFTPL